jgi:hypothetical protein
VNAPASPPRSPPRGFDDLVAFGDLLCSFEPRRPHFAAAVDEIDAHCDEPPLTTDQRTRLELILFGICTECLMFRRPQAKASELLGIPARAAARRREEEQDLELLSRARQSLAATGDAGAAVHALYAYLVEALLPQIAVPAWDETDPGHAPHRTHGSRLA